MSSSSDLVTMMVGASAWAMAIPVVKIAGNGVVTGQTMGKGLALIAGLGIAYATTPLLSMLLGWKTPNQKVRGVALALGTAQVIDGLVYILYPAFYHENPEIGLGCAGNIFLGAGLLGIFSAHQ